jgi:hypothetical protein
MIIITPLSGPKPRMLSGLGGFFDTIFGSDAAPSDPMPPEVPADSGSSSWFDWLGIGGDGAADACATGGSAQPGSECWNAGWRPNGQGGNVKTGAAPAVSTGSPVGWMDTLTNAISGITQGFYPKPASNTQATTTAPPVTTQATPWYKTTPGMLGIAAGVIAVAYAATKKGK